MPIHDMGPSEGFSYEPVDNSAKILSKQTKKSDIDQKISDLEGRIEILSSKLKNGNTVVKIKAFVGLFFARKDLHFKQKASGSLNSEIKKLVGTPLQAPSASLQDALEGRTSQVTHAKPAAGEQSIDKTADLLYIDEELGEKFNKLGLGDIPNIDED